MNRGNCNATKHPQNTYLKRRVVPSRYHGVLRLGDECEAKCKADLLDMTGKQSLVVEGIKILWVCAMLGLAEAKEKGFTVTKPDGTWDFQEGTKTAAGFIDKAIKGLTVLGLERKAKMLNGTISERLSQIHDAKEPDETR
jgi:hypothetical protein